MTERRTAYHAGPKPVEIRFTVTGNPIPKARARVTLRPGRRATAYTPGRTKAYEQEVALAARQAMGRRAPLAGPVGLELWLYRATMHRADADNMEKACTDAMNGIIYLDDAQIVECHRYKRLDRENPRAEVRVWEVTDL